MHGDEHVEGIDPFERLNEAERRVLIFLAQGHTVKSVAGSTGWTVAAVNERLRSARLKTGVASSRELARQYAQKNEATKIGLPGLTDEPTRIATVGGAPKRTLSKGQMIMSSAVLIALLVGGAIIQQSASSAPEAPHLDPLVGNLFARDYTPKKVLTTPHPQGWEKALADSGMEATRRGLYSEARAARDGAWSAATEMAIRTVVKAVPSVKASGSDVRATCSASLCEIATTTAANSTGKVVESFYIELQGKELDSQLKGLGLDHVLSNFGAADKSRHLYVSYWSRRP